jgi:hypothetical protein
MRRGCIAIGETKCDICQRNMEHGERYLLIAKDEAAEDKEQRICIECCEKEGYADWVTEKGEKILTFFGKS